MPNSGTCRILVPLRYIWNFMNSTFLGQIKDMTSNRPNSFYMYTCDILWMWHTMKLNDGNKQIRRKSQNYILCTKWTESYPQFDYRPLVFARFSKAVSMGINTFASAPNLHEISSAGGFDIRRILWTFNNSKPFSLEISNKYAAQIFIDLVCLLRESSIRF